jgi:hypothetical protein
MKRLDEGGTRSLVMTRFAVVAICALATAAVSCIGHTRLITLDDEDGALPVTRVEIEEAIAAIDESIRPLGMVTDPELGWIRRTSEQDRIDTPAVVICYWIKGPSLKRGDDVIVTLEREKRDGSVLVSIVNKSWPRPTKFADALEEAVKDALSQALPQRRVLIERRTGGLFIY